MKVQGIKQNTNFPYSGHFRDFEKALDHQHKLRWPRSWIWFRIFGILILCSHFHSQHILKHPARPHLNLAAVQISPLSVLLHKILLTYIKSTSWNEGGWGAVHVDCQTKFPTERTESEITPLSPLISVVCELCTRKKCQNVCVFGMFHRYMSFSFICTMYKLYCLRWSLQSIGQVWYEDRPCQTKSGSKFNNNHTINWTSNAVYFVLTSTFLSVHFAILYLYAEFVHFTRDQ